MPEEKEVSVAGEEAGEPAQDPADGGVHAPALPDLESKWQLLTELGAACFVAQWEKCPESGRIHLQVKRGRVPGLVGCFVVLWGSCRRGTYPTSLRCLFFCRDMYGSVSLQEYQSFKKRFQEFMQKEHEVERISASPIAPKRLAGLQILSGLATLLSLEQEEISK